MTTQEKIKYLEEFNSIINEWFVLRRGPGKEETKEKDLAIHWGVVSEILKGLDYNLEIELKNERGTKVGTGDLFHDGFYSTSANTVRIPSIKKIESYVLSAIEKLNSGQIVREDILPSVSTMLSILRTFPECVSRLKFRRKSKNPLEINDEYDVQDIVYIMLKGVFPTLQYEDPTPKVGPNSSRADFTVNDLGVYIETKYISEKGNEKSIHDECLADIQKYGKQDNCRKIIFFVYDPLKCVDNRHSFESGLGTIQVIDGKEIEIITLIIN